MRKLYTINCEVKDLVDKLKENYEIFIPKLSTKNGVSFVDWSHYFGDETEILINFTGQQKNSVKIFYFPQPETLIEFTLQSNKVYFNECKPQKHRLIFGVRPCDARSITLNKMHFTEDYYFMNNINNNFIIGLTCLEQCRTCFCLWTGGSPLGTEGMDLCISKLDEKIYLEVVSNRGEYLLKEHLTHLLSETNEKEIQRLDELRQLNEKRKETFPDPVKKLKEIELLSIYNKDFWRDLAYSCINCGICTFLCPTCFCFDIQDEVHENKGKRIRYWDSCMFALFTQHASGHNPRAEKYQRVRNRFMHKLKYYPDRYNVLSCVGCGRCIRECPVNIDIREVLRDMML